MEQNLISPRADRFLKKFIAEHIFPVLTRRLLTRTQAWTSAIADRPDPKIPANLEAAVKALANVPKIEALTVPMIPPGMEAIVKALNNVPRIEAFKVPQVDLSAFTKLQNDALTAFPAWQRQLTQQLRPIADLQ